MYIIKVYECIEKIILKFNYKGGRIFLWNIYSIFYDLYWI